ncbi:MAG: DNA gyrase subunit A [Clostridiales bacterium]|nr:DNA gyrase subunit A [Clostridiales bacterium]
MTKIINIEVEKELKQSFIDYAMCVNRSRAIPDVRDGLKPVHRRILYSMNELGLTPDKAYKKCATIVGDVLGKYHPHGDSSVYDALVRLAQDFSINMPLVDGHGNFGSVDGDPAAAYRYTEARMSKMALEMLREIDKETVDFYPNFDDTRMQPVVLPARYPNLLVNGADGIAVGMATNIPPHNLGEVIDGTIALLDNPELTVDELLKYIPAPDFPTGGIIMGRSGIRNAYRTGRGNIVLRAKCEIEEFNNGTRERIIVTELPYQVNKQKLIETIADYVRTKRIEGISNVNDESDRHGMRVVIEVKKDANAQVVLNTLYKQTNLQTSGGIILLALVGTDPKVLNIKEILEHYIAHQIDVITRRTKFDLAKAREREHLVRGLVIALANIDEVIAIIKRSKDREDATNQLKESFLLDDIQAHAILDMRLQRLTSMEVEKLNEELRQLEALIADLTDILEKPERVKAIVRNDLEDVKNRYPTPRKTEISTDYADIGEADLIEREDIIISMTHQGYIKRIPVKEWKAQRRGGRGLTAHKTKDEDFVETMFVCSTHDDLLFFSSFGKVYRIKGYEVPEAQRVARGRAIVNLIQVDKDERITAVIPRKEIITDNEATEETADELNETEVTVETAEVDTETAEETVDVGYIMMATKFGLIKKTALKEFNSIRKGGKIAISLLPDDELISVQLTDGENEILIGSHEGKCIRFSESDVRAMGRDTQGVRSIDLNDGDYVIDMQVIHPTDTVITVSSNGYGKRSSIEEYRLQSRAGKGIKAGVFNEKTGYLVGIKPVNEDEDIMMISDQGVAIRTQVNEISLISRDTQGVRVMKLNGAQIATIAVAPHEDEEEIEYDEDGNPIAIEGEENAEQTTENATTETVTEE